MNARTLTITIALLFSAGCVAQVGQPEEKTGTIRSTLGNEPEEKDPSPGDPGGENATDNTAADPGNNSTSEDNQGPQPLPWNTTSSTTPSAGTEAKK